MRWDRRDSRRHQPGAITTTAASTPESGINKRPRPGFQNASMSLRVQNDVSIVGAFGNFVVMPRLCRIWRDLLLAPLIIATQAFSAESDNVTPWRQDQPPNRPYSPQEALTKMKVPDGFKVDLVASEPDVVNPIGMSFDDRGRIWITESIEYPRKPAGPGRDRVKVLEDADGDGRADKVTVFAEGLNIPTGVAVGYGGVWVLNAPDLLL